MINANTVRKQIVEVLLIGLNARAKYIGLNMSDYTAGFEAILVKAEIQALEAELAELNKPVSPLT